MDKLTSLAISYPDFQLNQIIDPEQMDLNNLQIVNKINTVIKAINELIFGTGGASHITIAPIPEFSDAKTVQQALQKIATFVKTLDADTKKQFAELVQKNSQQDTEIQSIKSVNTRQDSRLQSLESTQTSHTQRIGAIEQKNTSQDDEINAIKQKNNEQDGRLTKAESTISTHTTQISKVQEKDVEQDRRISGIESREELDTAFVTKIEKRVGVNETDIQKLQEDFAQLEGKDPVAELVIARTSGHTQETFRTLGDRLDHNEIPVKTDFTGQLRGAVNFRVVDENTTETWENHVKLGDITAHDESPIAHEVMMAEHELDETSHNDIREKIATHETSGTAHGDIREKIVTLTGSDVKNVDTINITDANNLPVGWYTGNLTNAPYTDWATFHTFNKLGDSYRTQVAYGVNNPFIAYRNYINSGYEEWIELASKKYVDQQNELDMRYKSFATGTQTYTATKTGIYLTSNADVVDLPEGWSQGRHCIATFNPNNDIYGFQLITSYPGGSGLGNNRRLAFRSAITEGSEWREIATTDKKEILFPYNSGFRGIDSEPSYIHITNNIVTLVMNFCKVDGSTFDGSEIFATLPSSYRPKNYTRFYLSSYGHGYGWDSTTGYILSDGKIGMKMKNGITIHNLYGTITYQI